MATERPRFTSSQNEKDFSSSSLLLLFFAPFPGGLAVESRGTSLT